MLVANQVLSQAEAVADWLFPSSALVALHLLLHVATDKFDAGAGF